MPFMRSMVPSGTLHLLISLALAGLLALWNPAAADPPPWAPAHGYHKNKHSAKHKHKHRHKHRHKHKHEADGYDYDDYAHHGDDDELLPWLVGGAAAAGYISGSRCKREALGAVLGGVVGGVAGSELGKGENREAATIAGALIGVLVGRSIGRSLDRADQYCTGQTLEYAQDQRAVEWQDPDNRNRYRVTPVNTYQSRDGRYCREYTTRATIGGRQQETYGTACRQPDGSWEVVNLAPMTASQAF